MNRASLRKAQRHGKRRTKPPAAHIKAHLPGDHACAARQVLIARAVNGWSRTAPEDLAKMVRDVTPCRAELHQ